EDLAYNETPDFFSKKKNPASPELSNSAKPKKNFSYIIGNPPFIGKQLQNREQKDDLAFVTNKMKNYTDLDYVSGWYIKSAQFIQGTKTKVAFVSTNSIVQGEQTSILW